MYYYHEERDTKRNELLGTLLEAPQVLNEVGLGVNVFAALFHESTVLGPIWLLVLVFEHVPLERQASVFSQPHV